MRDVYKLLAVALLVGTLAIVATISGCGGSAPGGNGMMDGAAVGSDQMATHGFGCEEAIACMTKQALQEGTLDTSSYIGDVNAMGVACYGMIETADGKALYDTVVTCVQNACNSTLGRNASLLGPHAYVDNNGQPDVQACIAAALTNQCAIEHNDCTNDN